MGFNSWHDFRNFENNVRYKNRFIHSSEVNEFIINIKETLPKRIKILTKDKILYRAQIGCDEIDCEVTGMDITGYSPERMKPILNKGIEGRANPKGISYLYLSTDINTSLAELRPNREQYLSSAQFKVRRDLKIVNCYSVPRHYDYFECLFNEPKSQDEIINAVWSMINNAFTKAVTNHDSATDYIPTQFLAEFFRAENFDGLYFKSGVGSGFNVVLFKLDDASLVNCTVMKAKSITYEFEECANRYFIKSDI